MQASLVEKNQKTAKFKVSIQPILQQSETECGVAALAMLFAHYDVNIPLEILRDQCGTSRDGCKASTLLAVAREYGFHADGYRVELEDIAAQGCPVIAFWNFNHYIIICGVDHKNVYINDPAQGRLTVSLSEFDQSFTGVILAITPTAAVKKVKPTSTINNYFKDWFWQFKLEWLFMVTISLLFMTAPLLNSLVSSIFINYCVIGANQYWLPWLALFVLLIAVFMMVIIATQQKYQFKIITKASLLKTSSLIMRTLRLPLLYFSLRQKSEIIVILSRAESVINSFFTNLTNFAVNGFMLVCCLGGMLVIDASLTMKLLAIFAVLTFFVTVLSKINLALEKKQITSERKLYAFAMASLRNIETIKSCAMEFEILSKWHALFCKNLQSRDKINGITAKTASLSQLANSLSLLAIMYWGSINVAQGVLSVGNLLAYYVLVMLFNKNAEAVLLAYKQIQKAYAAHLQVNDLTITKTDQRFVETKNNIFYDEKQSLLACKNLKFFYNKRQAPVLENINLEIASGQQIAFVGATGSGKSTLAKLLCGLYSVDKGEVLLSGANIKTFSQDNFCQQFSYVSQEITLFSGTLFENLTLGNHNTPLHKIHDAIEQAGLQELIALRGLHAKVDEMGNNFSGGEKQRLEIARALLQDAPILILDEATSALDLTTEAKIINNLRKLNKTIIYVAHRLSTIQHCDTIYVLEKGQVVEQGSHQQLLKNQKQYYQLIQEELFPCQ